MKKDDLEILREVQKDTGIAIKAIDTMFGKVRNDELSKELSRERLAYSVIQNKATDRLQNSNADGYSKSAVEDMMISGSIHLNTLANCSSGKIAELMIDGSNRNITRMWKAVNRHGNSGETSMEIARELMDFEEKSIGCLKKFL